MACLKLTDYDNCSLRFHVCEYIKRNDEMRKSKLLMINGILFTELKQLGILLQGYNRPGQLKVSGPIISEDMHYEN